MLGTILLSGGDCDQCSNLVATHPSIRQELLCLSLLLRVESGILSKSGTFGALVSWALFLSSLSAIELPLCATLSCALTHLMVTFTYSVLLYLWQN